MIAIPSNPRQRTERRFRRALHAAMRSLGWILPATEAEVKATSQEDVAEALELPNELRNPFAALERNYEADRCERAPRH